MTKPTFPYTKLPARRKGLVFSSTLWLGDDHILSVRNTRFQETYNRYFYKDIQAIEMRKAARFNIPPLLPVVLFLLGIPTIALAVSRGVRVGMIGLGAVLAVIAWGIFVATSRSCICHVVTALGRDELPALIRTQKSITAVDLIAARVQAAQGELSGDWQQNLPAVATTTTAAAWQEQSASPQPSLWPGFYLACAAILLMFIDGLITVADLQLVRLHPPPWLGNANLLLQVTATLLFIMTTARAQGLRNLKIAVIGSTVFAGGISYLSYIVGMAAASVSQREQSIVSTFTRGIGFVNIAGDLILTIVAGVVLMQSRKFFRKGAGA